MNCNTKYHTSNTYNAIGPKFASNSWKLNLRNKSVLGIIATRKSGCMLRPYPHLQGSGLSLSRSQCRMCVILRTHALWMICCPTWMANMQGIHIFFQGLWLAKLSAWCAFFRRELWAGEHSFDFSTLPIICHLCSQAVHSVNPQDIKTLALPLVAKASLLQHWPQHPEHTASVVFTDSKSGRKTKQTAWSLWHQKEQAVTLTFALSQRTLHGSVVTSTAQGTGAVLLSTGEGSRVWASAEQ